MVSGEGALGQNLALGPQGPSNTLEPLPVLSTHPTPPSTPCHHCLHLRPPCLWNQVGTTSVPFPAEIQAHHWLSWPSPLPYTSVPGGGPGTQLAGWLCLEGTGSPLESYLPLRPWQEYWQPQHCACPRLSREAPGVSSGAASSWCRPSD